MKPFILTFVISCCFLLGLSAQNEGIQRFFDKYGQYNTADQVELRKQIKEEAAGISKDQDLLSKIEALQILHIEGENPVTEADYADLIEAIQQDDFEQLLQVRAEDAKVDFYLLEDGDFISDIALVISSPDDFVLISLQGELALEDFEEVTRDLPNAVDGLRRLPNHFLEIRPNPSFGPEFTIERQADIRIEEIRVYDSNGQLVKTIREDVNTLNLDGSGFFFVEIQTNQGVLVKKIIRNQ